MIRSLRRDRRRSSFPLLSAVVGLSVLPGIACQQAGPRGIERERVNYNLAVQRTNEEQLLLNLVRMKYRDTPFFIKVSSISSQVEWEKGLALNASTVEGGSGTYGLGASFRHMEIPTVTYSPLEGQEFSQTLLSPISIDTLVLLAHSGWSIERILRAFVRRLGPLSNAVGAGGPTPRYVPEYEPFRRACRLLRELQILDAIDFSSQDREEGRRIVLRFHTPVEEQVRQKQSELRKVLGLGADGLEYPLVLEAGETSPDFLRIRMRSFLSSLFFLSQGVEAPVEDRDAGLVTVTKHPDGKVFQWSELLGDLIRVQSGPKPKQSAVAVRYRSSWFWIADDDLNSKSTFALLDQLFALQAAPVEGAKPVLTLPLSR